MNTDNNISTSLLPLGEDCLDIFMFSRIEPSLPQDLYAAILDGTSPISLKNCFDRSILSTSNTAQAIESLSQFIASPKHLILNMGMICNGNDSNKDVSYIPILQTILQIEWTETVDYFILEIKGDNRLGFHPSYLQFVANHHPSNNLDYDFFSTLQHHQNRFVYLNQFISELIHESFWEESFKPCPKHILQLDEGIHPFAILQRSVETPFHYLQFISHLSGAFESFTYQPFQKSTLLRIPVSFFEQNITELIDRLIPFSNNILIVDPSHTMPFLANEAKSKDLILQFDNQDSIRKSLLHFLNNPFKPSKKEEDLLARWLSVKQEQVLLENQLMLDCDQLNKPIIDEQSWTELLNEHIFNEKNDFIQFMDEHLSKVDYTFTIIEYRTIQKELASCRDSYHRLGSLKNPILQLNANHAVFERDNEEIPALVAIQLRGYISDLQQILYNDKIDKRKRAAFKIEQQLAHLYDLKSEASYLKQLLVVHQQHFGDHIDLNKNFHFFKNKMLGFFSTKHQRLFDSHKKIDLQIQRLKNTYTQSKINDLILPFTPLAFTSQLYISKLNRLLSDIDVQIHSTNQSVLDTSKHRSDPSAESNIQLNESTSQAIHERIAEIQRDGLFKGFIPSDEVTLTANDVFLWIDQLHAVVDQIHTLSDRIDWHQIFETISLHTKGLIRFFDRSKVSDWATAFRSWYTFKLLTTRFSTTLLLQDVYQSKLLQRMLINKQFLDQHTSICRHYMDKLKRSEAFEKLVKKKSLDRELIARFLENKKTMEIIQWIGQKSFTAIFPYVYTTKTDLPSDLFASFNTIISGDNDRKGRNNSILAQQQRIEVLASKSNLTKDDSSIEESVSFTILKSWIYTILDMPHEISAGRIDQWYDLKISITAKEIDDKTKNTSQPEISTQIDSSSLFLTLDQGVHGRKSHQLIQNINRRNEMLNKSNKHINISSFHILHDIAQIKEKLLDQIKALAQDHS